MEFNIQVARHLPLSLRLFSVASILPIEYSCAVPPHAIASARARLGSQCTLALIAAVFVALLTINASELGAEEARVFYKYTDSSGGLHMVQSLDRVPPQYRNQIAEIALDGEPQWIKNTAPAPPARARMEYEPVKRHARGRSSGVVLYYADWCPYCKKAKRWLDERDVAYTIRDIDVPRYGEELEEVSGGTSVPVLSVGGEIIRGFNPAAYEEALGG